MATKARTALKKAVKPVSKFVRRIKAVRADLAAGRFTTTTYLVHRKTGTVTKVTAHKGKP